MAKRPTNTKPVSSEAPALLAAIIEQPDEDTPRLMYADLLDEIGGAANRDRAEFIRLQIGAAQHGDREDLALSGRANSLFTANRGAWVAELGVRVGGAHFRRGFAEVVMLSAADFIRHGERLLRAAPIRSVDVHDFGDRADKLAACPALERVVTLGLTDQRDVSINVNDGIEPICHSPHVGGLKRLLLGWGATWSVTALIGSPLLSRLTALELSCDDVDADDVEALVSDPAFAGITSFSLTATDIGDAGARVLAMAPTLGGLRELGLRLNKLTNAGALALARSSTLRSLRYLDVSENRIGIAGLRALDGRLGLTELGVVFNCFSRAGLALTDRIRATKPLTSVLGWAGRLEFPNMWKKS